MGTSCHFRVSCSDGGQQASAWKLGLQTMPFQVQLAKGSTCPREGDEQLADIVQLSTHFQHIPQQLFSSGSFSGYTGPSYLALTVSLKLGQLQGDLGILAAYRNKSKVSPAGVAQVG